MILILDKKITPEELKKAREVYDDYIKTVIDVEKDLLAVGCEYHIDCEEELIRMGRKMDENIR